MYLGKLAYSKPYVYIMSNYHNIFIKIGTLLMWGKTADDFKIYLQATSEQREVQSSLHASPTAGCL